MILNSTFNTVGSYSIAMTNFSILADQSLDILSIAPAIDLIDGITYMIAMNMKDIVDNEEASSPTVVIVFDTFTRTPTLQSILPDFPIKVAFQITFELPEEALPGSVKLSFAPESGGEVYDGNGTRSITFSSLAESSGKFAASSLMTQFSSASEDHAFIVSVSPPKDLLHMANYTVTLSYRDTANNDAATDSLLEWFMIPSQKHRISYSQ